MTDQPSVPASAAGRPRPLLMVPLRRCGSHALRLRLNFSSGFHSPYPLHIVDFLPLVPLYGDLADDRNYFQLVVDVVGLQAVSMVKWPGGAFDPGEIFDAIKDEKRSVHRVVWELLLRSGEQHHAQVVMDKSLDSIHDAAELLELFPDMLFLNVVRDPRAQVASMNRAIIHDFDSTLNAMTWVAAHDAAQRLVQAHPQRVLTIRYEDFLADQELVLRGICDFIGLDFLPQMLDVAASTEARQMSKLSDLWSSNCFGPIPANKDKFKSQLSPGDIEIIETLAQAHMRSYGYEFMTDANAPAADPAVLAARVQASAMGRAHAWSRLSESNYRDFILRRARAEHLSSVRDRLMQAQKSGVQPGVVAPTGA